MQLHRVHMTQQMHSLTDPCSQWAHGNGCWTQGVYQLLEFVRPATRERQHDWSCCLCYTSSTGKFSGYNVSYTHIFILWLYTLSFTYPPKNESSKGSVKKDNVGPHNWPSSSHPLTWQNSYSNNHETKWKKYLIKLKHCMNVIKFTAVTVRLKKGISFPSYVYWTVHHLDSSIKRDELDVTCFIISLFNAQHVSNVNTSILRSLRLICWVISWVVLLRYDVCWCYVMVWLGWCGIWMQVETLVLQPASSDIKMVSLYSTIKFPMFVDMSCW